MSLWIIRKGIICLLAIITLLLGAFSFLVGSDVAQSTSESKREEIQFPLGDLRGIVVDDEGRVYCGVHFYSRVHVYDNQGNFLYSLSINGGKGGDFRLKLDSNNNLNVATVRNKMLYVFDKEGKLLKKEMNERAYYEFDMRNEREFIANDNVSYKINNPLLMFPRVTKISTDGEKSTLVTSTLKSWLLMGPLPAWLFCVIGMFLLYGGFSKPRIMEVLKEIYKHWK